MNAAFLFTPLAVAMLLTALPRRKNASTLNEAGGTLSRKRDRGVSSVLSRPASLSVAVCSPPDSAAGGARFAPPGRPGPLTGPSTPLETALEATAAGFERVWAAVAPSAAFPVPHRVPEGPVPHRVPEGGARLTDGDA